jgi:hypothetical protein
VTRPPHITLATIMTATKTPSQNKLPHKPHTHNHKPMTKISASNELAEYTNSIRDYLEAHRNSRESSPEFLWKDLPSKDRSGSVSSNGNGNGVKKSASISSKSSHTSTKSSSSKKHYMS